MDRKCPYCGVGPEHHPDVNALARYIRECVWKFEDPYWINPQPLVYCVDVSFSVPCPKFNTITEQEEDVIEDPMNAIKTALREAMSKVEGITEISIDNYDLI